MTSNCAIPVVRTDKTDKYLQIYLNEDGKHGDEHHETFMIMLIVCRCYEKTTNV